MKGNQIDDLFREKLSHQKLAPPPSAWGAVEQNLPGKKKKGAYFWISIAASLLVIATLGWVLISGNAGTPDTDSQFQANKEPIKEEPAEAQPEQTLVAEASEEPETIKEELPARVDQTFDISQAKDIVASGSSIVTATEDEIPMTELVSPRALIAVRSLSVEHLTLDMPASTFKFDMVMPLDLTAFHIPYTEDLEIAPKKKKFRMLNGIISIAKEVNSGKLSFSELRNAKNNFVVDDLKYGSKEVDSDPEEGPNDDKPNAPGKD